MRIDLVDQDNSSDRCGILSPAGTCESIAEEMAYEGREA